MEPWKIIYTFATLWKLTGTIPTISYPINSQVPPVARMFKSFSYTFASSTFSSNLPLNYTLSTAPSWLSLNSDTRTLFGTPSINDVGSGTITGVEIGLTASDESGSVVMNSTFVISRDPAPVINIPLASQLPSLGAFSLPSTLLLHPSTAFSFNFDPNTFSEDASTSSNLTYYATTVNNTPLPSWIIFDDASLSFSGQTPPYTSLIQPPQTFGIQITLSDVEGFAGASIPFEIEVGIHLLAFSNEDMILDATPGAEVTFHGLSNNLNLDGQLAPASILVSVTAEIPLWLVFDKSTFDISGTAPSDAISCNITVHASDVYGDTASATIFVNVTSDVFKGEIGDLEATIGSALTYDLSPYLVNKSNTNMNAQFSPPTSWIFFDNQTFILSGQVPSAAQPSQIGILLQASLVSSNALSSESFRLFLVSQLSQTYSPTISTSLSASSAGAVSTTSSVPVSGTARRRISKIIVVAIVVPMTVLLLGILAALLCYKLRKRAGREYPTSSSKSEAPLSQDQAPSVVDIDRHPVIKPLDRLKLDMSTFGDDNRSGTTIMKTNRLSTLSDGGNLVRRSQTVSAMSGTLESELLDSDISGTMTRACSENELSKAERSWGSTQDSPHQNIGSQTNSTRRLTRNYSNYSRKGHHRRSGRVWSSDQPRQDSSSYSQPAGGSVPIPRDKDISVTPLDNLSALSEVNDSHKSAAALPSIKTSRQPKLRRQPRSISQKLPSHNDIGHGGRVTISSLSGRSEKTRSVGHGQDWIDGQALTRDSRTWLTVNEQHRYSNSTDTSEAANGLYTEHKLPKSTKEVSQSPQQPYSASLSKTDATSRPHSRRIGSSPFFGGSSSRRSPKRARISYADSPTVPDEAMGPLSSTILHSSEEESFVQQDPFGISYGSTREGTRQLRPYIQHQLRRAQTRESIRSNESKDSRFESASGSMLSAKRFHSFHNVQRAGADTRYEEDEYEEFLPDGCSEESWETNHTNRDSPVDTKYKNETLSAAQVTIAEAEPSSLQPRLCSLATSTPNSPMVDIGSNARMRSARGRRPISVDAKATRRASRAVVEHPKGEPDYAAYI